MTRPVKKVPQAKSPGEEALALQLRAEFIDYEREVMPIEGRRFRFDIAIWQHRILVEVDGGWGWNKRAIKVNGKTYIPIGAHNSRKGSERDREKDHLAIMDGWVVLRFTSAQVKSGYALKTIMKVQENREYV